MTSAPSIHSLIHVSRNRLEPPLDPVEIAVIAAVSRARNAELGITGALIATPRYFAQILEGRPAALDGMMALIAGDPRHADLVIVRREVLAGRRLLDWSVVYVGSAGYVDRAIGALAEASAGTATGNDTDGLLRLFTAFARAAARPVGGLV